VLHGKGLLSIVLGVSSVDSVFVCLPKLLFGDFFRFSAVGCLRDGNIDFSPDIFSFTDNKGPFFGVPALFLSQWIGQLSYAGRECPPTLEWSFPPCPPSFPSSPGTFTYESPFFPCRSPRHSFFFVPSCLHFLFFSYSSRPFARYNSAQFLFIFFATKGSCAIFSRLPFFLDYSRAHQRLGLDVVLPLRIFSFL